MPVLYSHNQKQWIPAGVDQRLIRSGASGESQEGLCLKEGWVEAALLPGRCTLRSASREDASRTAAACTILLVQTLSTRQTVEGRVPYRDDTYRLLVALGFRPPAPGEELYRSEDCGTDPEDAKDLAPWLPDVQEKKDNGDGRAWMIDMDVLLNPENARL